MLGYTRPVTQRATHYHTGAVNPVWSAGLVETAKIGTHVFYRFPTGSERAFYQEALARRRGAAGPSRSALEDLIPEAAEAVAEEAVAADAVEPAPADATDAAELAPAADEVAT